jgi:hypothetical protein
MYNRIRDEKFGDPDPGYGIKHPGFATGPECFSSSQNCGRVTTVGFAAKLVTFCLVCFNRRANNSIRKSM